MDTATRHRINGLAEDFAAGRLPEQAGKAPVYVYCPNCRTENGNPIRTTGPAKLPTTLDGSDPCSTCGGRGIARRAGADGKLERVGLL